MAYLRQPYLTGGRNMNRHPTREAEMIRKARYRMGYSQQQVANMLGIQIRQYQRFEYGETDICKIQLKPGLILCAILEINPICLIFNDSGETLMEMKTQRPTQAICRKQSRDR